MRYKSCLLGILAGLLFGAGVTTAQDINGTQQLVNRGFEEYDNLGADEVEPVGYNSFMTGNASGLTTMGQSQRLDRSDEKRPGSTGSYCVRAYSTAISLFGSTINANGTFSTGRINLGSTTATDLSNHAFTDRENSGFNFPFTSIPDSMVVWVKYAPNDASDQGQVNAIIHDDFKMQDPGVDMNHAVVIACANPTKGNGGWVRYSIPFSSAGCGSKDPRYLLLSVTTNKVAGGGAAEIYIDDILFVYNPEIKTGTLPALSFNLRDGAQTFQLPYTLTGTIMLNSNDAVKNEVIAELSDASGSFANPTEIGRAYSEQSGSLTVKIPGNTALGSHYRIRLRTTLRGLVSEDNGQDIVLMKGYTMSLTTNGEFGTVSGGGGYSLGAEVVAHAKPYVGYHFVRWEDADGKEVSASADYTFTMPDYDYTLTAVFAINRYTLEIVSEGGEGNILPGVGTHEYDYNTRVEITANPHTGYDLDGIYNGENLLSRLSPYYVSMTSSLTLTVRFKAGKIRMEAVANNPSLGTVSGSGLYTKGSQVRLSAKPAPFCRFVAWMEGADTLSREPDYTFVAETARSITAVFAENYYYVTLATCPKGAGNLYGAGRFSAAAADVHISIETQAKGGYEFLYWAENPDTGAYASAEEVPQTERIYDNPYLYMDGGRMTADAGFTAYFKDVRYKVETYAEPEDAGAVSGAGSYAYGESAVLTASPSEGYAFVQWERLNGAEWDSVSQDNPYTVEAVSGDMVFRAVFALKRYEVRLETEPSGSVTGDSIYRHGDTVRLTAIPVEGNVFDCWAIRQGLNLEPVSTDNPFVFEIVSPVEYVAVFVPRPKIVSAVSIPEGAGVLSGQGNYQAGVYASIKAYDTYGYHFSCWVNADTVRTYLNPNLRLLVSEDTLLRALYKANTFNLLVMSEGARSIGSVSVEGAPWASIQENEVDYDDVVLVQARAEKENYGFFQWRIHYTDENGKECDSLYSREDSIYYKMKGDATLVAYFRENLHRVRAAVFMEGDELPADASAMAAITDFNAVSAFGRVEGVGNHRSDNWIELLAVPAPGYAFSRWVQTTGEEFVKERRGLYITITQDTLIYALFKPDSVRVRLSNESHPDWGSIAGAGYYRYGDTVELKANAASGYDFAGWEEMVEDGGLQRLGTDTCYRFEVNRNMNIRAAFVPQIYKAEADIEPEQAGEVKGLGNYAYSEEVRLEAYARPGFVFSAWLVENPLDVEHPDTLRTYVFSREMRGDLHAKALFEPVSFRWEIRSDNLSEGEFEGEVVGYAAKGSQLAFQDKIKAKPHYKFYAWKNERGEILSTKADAQFTLMCDTVLYADFTGETLKLSASSADDTKGYVEAYNNRGEYGTVTEINASPMPGYIFEKWTDASGKTLSESSRLAVLRLSDTNLTACFMPAPYLLETEIEPMGSGKIVYSRKMGRERVQTSEYTEAGTREMRYGDTVVMRAVPVLHHRFSAWQKDGVIFSEDTEVEVCIEQAHRLVAVFEPIAYIVSLVAEPASYGSVSGEGSFYYGQSANLRAEPGEQFRFVGWRSEEAWIGTHPEMEFMPESDAVLTAVFAVDSLSVSAESQWGGYTQGGGLYEKGSEAVLTAVPHTGYMFVAWKDASGNRISVENPMTVRVEEDAVYRAEFMGVKVEVEVAAGEGGAVSGGGTVSYGGAVKAFAMPDKGYHFDGWTVEGVELTQVQTSAPYLVLDVTEPLKIQARFAPDKLRVSTLASPLQSGIVTKGGDFDFGAQISFEAKPEAGYVFAGWTQDGKIVETEPTLKVEVSEDAYYIALFEPKPLKALVEAYPSTGGLTYGGGTYFWGDTVLIGISPYEGFALTDWKDKDFKVVSQEAFFHYVLLNTDMFTASLSGSSPQDTIPIEPEPEEDTLVRYYIYPNPVVKGGDLNIRMETGDLRYIKFFTLTGAQIYYRKFSDRGVREVRMNIPSWMGGCYVYEFGLANGEVRRGKFIVK